MVTLRGFPLSNIISEVDASEEDLVGINPQSAHQAALIGFSSKGPINEPIRISSLKELHKTFGKPTKDCHLVETAEQILFVANSLIIIRIANDSKLCAETCILDDNGQPCLKILADSEGSSGIYTKVKVINEDDRFSMRIYHRGIVVEHWEGLSRDPSDDMYVESFINSFSNYIRVRVQNESGDGLPQEGAFSLGCADTELHHIMNGICNSKEEDELFIKALKILEDEDSIDLDFIALPGCTSVRVIENLLSVCEQRGDCFAIIDTPVDFSYEDAVAWQNSLPTSNFGAIYWPWVWSNDSNNGKEVLMPPCGSALAVIAKSDVLSAPWHPATGMSRGVVPGILGVSQELEDEEYEAFKGQSTINPIINSANTGANVINSQLCIDGSTVSERRITFLVKKLISRSVNRLLSDCDVSDEFFRKSFTRICNKILNRIKSGRGIQDYSIQVDDELNAESKETEEFRAIIGIRPTRTQSAGTDTVVYIYFAFQQSGDEE